MKIAEMNKKQLKEARESLLKYVNENSGLKVSRITGLSDSGCMLEGGRFPATFDFVTRRLWIWGRGSRYAGSSMSVAQLKQVEDVLVSWFVLNSN